MATIYIIDDHALLCDTLAQFLRTRGHQVLGTCQAASPGLTEVLRLQPDILLLDLRLGLRSGFEILSELQRRRSRVRTLVMTVSDHAGHVADALRYGAMGYLIKTATGGDRMLAAIEDAMQGKRSYSDQVGELAVEALSRPREVNPFSALSAREKQVLMLVIQGHSSARIGEAMYLSRKTVETYRSRAMTKLGVDNLQGLMVLAMRNGLVDEIEDGAG